MTEWYMQVDGSVAATTITSDTLIALIRRGPVPVGVLIRERNGSVWLPLDAVPEFAAALRDAAGGRNAPGSAPLTSAPVNDPPAKQMRVCPHCAEDVLAAATLCKHCKSSLEPIAAGTPAPSMSRPMDSGSPDMAVGAPVRADTSGARLPSGSMVGRTNEVGAEIGPEGEADELEEDATRMARRRRSTLKMGAAVVVSLVVLAVVVLVLHSGGTMLMSARCAIDSDCAEGLLCVPGADAKPQCTRPCATMSDMAVCQRHSPPGSGIAFCSFSEGICRIRGPCPPGARVHWVSPDLDLCEPE